MFQCTLYNMSTNRFSFSLTTVLDKCNVSFISYIVSFILFMQNV